MKLDLKLKQKQMKIKIKWVFIAWKIFLISGLKKKYLYVNVLALNWGHLKFLLWNNKRYQ